MSARDALLDEYGRADTAPLGTLTELRAKLAAIRAEDLREAADAINALPEDYECDPGRGDAADLLRRMADEAGKDTRTPGESTRAESPWQQAVDGLNALTDAGVDFHIEPDGHIANPLGGEHIEWDRASQRWRLVHDDEAEGGAPPVAERQLTKDNAGEIDDWLDRVDVFAKPYVETVDGRLTLVGLRIGLRPDRVIARFGDTLVRHADGTHTVRRAEGGDADA
ncbi:hypothetical protein AB0B15_39605 [Streptomyces sp. NPDC045456]|uniref:hypothetical protein n=1 Tax=Streptomyces sp. NPDC045456 TaxID=3155254 RepID=UPI0033D7C2DB